MVQMKTTALNIRQVFYVVKDFIYSTSYLHLQSFTGPQDLLHTTLVNSLLASVFFLPSLYHWLFFLCSLHFCCEDGGNKFFWNSKYLPDYVVLHFRIQHSSFTPVGDYFSSYLQLNIPLKQGSKAQNYEGYLEGHLQWTVNQLNGYDVITDELLCIVVGMTSLHVMHVSSYTIVDIMTVSSINLYAMLARFSSYFRVWQEGADCLIAVLGSSFASKPYGRS
jgi:hypothetical protein